MTEKSRTDMISENLIRAFIQFRRLRVDEGNPEQSHFNKCHRGLKHSEVMLLFELKEVEDRYPDGVSVSDISNCLKVKPPSITPIISSLEQKEMLERSMDPNDRRIIRLRLKEKGNQFVDANRQHMVSRVYGLVEYLGEEKSIQLT